MSETIQPPAGMRWREIVLGNGACRVRYTHRFEYLVCGTEAWKPSSALDAEMFDVWIDLRANNLEPVPPAPVDRDATWEAVRRLVESTWEASIVRERSGDTPDWWLGTLSVTDEILRLVRAATPRDPRIVRVLDGWYNVDPWGAHFHPTSDAARQAANPREALHTGVRLAVVTEDAETLECPDCAHHRADREAVLHACGVSEQTEDTLAGEVRAAIAQGTPTATLSTGPTILDPQWRWVGDALETRYPDEPTWKPALSIPVDRWREIVAMRHTSTTAEDCIAWLRAHGWGVSSMVDSPRTLLLIPPAEPRGVE